MINICLCLITVVAISMVIHNMYKNIIFLRQSKKYFEWRRKKDLKFIQDFVELRKRIEKLELNHMNLKENDMINVKKIKMKDVDHCIVCGEYIGFGNDPAICKSDSCQLEFEIEVEFNRFAKKRIKINK